MSKNCIMMLILLTIFCTAALGAPIDLSNARIVVLDPKSKIMTNAADMILDEIEKRTRIALQTSSVMPGKYEPVILIGLGNKITKTFPLPVTLEMPSKADGYAVWIDTTKRDAVTVCLAGVDERGALFATGKLLRLLDMSRDTLSIDSKISIATAPDIALRGHQFGYRPKTNSYDAWTIDMWEQYYREMAVFGMNAIELIPPRSDDADDSPHFPKPKMEMMVLMSQLADDYGIDVWIWFPALDKDYTDNKTVDAAIKEWGEVFGKLPRIDAVFVPGGDPGKKHHPAILLSFIEKQKKNLNKYHPKAQMWMSPQDFHETKGFWPAFLDIMQNQQPDWLDGIVFGPSVWVPLQEPNKKSPPKPKRRRTKIDIAMASLPALRKAIPVQYPIRRYPDITHSGGSQYEIPNRDLAWGKTLGREPINPRPIAYTKIFRDLQQYSIGFITYSEGCNDDFNKVLWSCLGWDIDMDPKDIAEEYARFFVSPRYAEKFAKGLFALEQNTLGPLLLNDQPYKTLSLFQEMEANATPQEKLSWRFQQGLYRAYYDAYIKARLHYETELERQALDVLKNAESIGSLYAIDKAQSILDKGITQRTRSQWRQRTFEFAEALYQSIRMQLSVEKYQAISIQRGANLDSIDKPFFERQRLIKEFDKIRKMTSEKQRLEAIQFNKTARQWIPLEWSLKNPTFKGNPYDLIATVTFVHPKSGNKHITEMFYDGNNIWKFRFTGTRPGRWTFTTSSKDEDLDSKQGTVMIKPNQGVNGFVTNFGNKWGWTGTNRAFVPQLVMYASPKYFYRNADKIDADIRKFFVEHGFNGFHVMGSCHWFDIEKKSSSEIDNPDPNPDRRTFEALELLITKVHGAGGMVHIWAWGDDSRKWTPTRWGKNGTVDQRLQRYIAARLGPLPGWTMGYGFDNWEWVDKNDLRRWHGYMHKHFGWPHLLGARAHSNRLTQIYEGLDYSGYEHHRPGYETYVETIEKRSNKPSFSEDRFRIRQRSGYEYKDYDMEMTRRGLWHSTMAGGVANIWGCLNGQQSELGSKLYPQPEQLKTYSKFFRNRFLKDMVRDNTITDGVCLKAFHMRHYLFYKENTTSIEMDLSAMSEVQKAIAVDTKKPYREILIGQLTPNKLTWKAKYKSDWIIAVGDFASRTFSRIPTF